MDGSDGECSATDAVATTIVFLAAIYSAAATDAVAAHNVFAVQDASQA